MHLISRLSIFVLLFVAFIGGAGAASAAVVAEGEQRCDPNLAVAEGSGCNDDQEVNGFLALVSPRGEQVAVYCVGDAFQYTAQLDWAGSVVFSGNAFGFDCDSRMISLMLSGHRPVVNTTPTEGWVYDPWSNTARICRNGMMTTLFATPPGDRPDHDTEPSTGCGYLSLPGA